MAIQHLVTCNTLDVVATVLTISIGLIIGATTGTVTSNFPGNDTFKYETNSSEFFLNLSCHDCDGGGFVHWDAIGFGKNGLIDDHHEYTNNLLMTINKTTVLQCFQTAGGEWRSKPIVVFFGKAKEKHACKSKIKCIIL